MNRIWSVLLMLLVLTWGSPTPAAAKVEHFKDNQGTLHITNEKAEDQAPKPEAAPSVPGPLQRRMLPPTPHGVSKAPPEPVEVPEAAPEPEPPPETETQPDSS